MYNNSQYGFHFYEDTTPLQENYEYCLVRDFNFIILFEVSLSVLLRCTPTDTFVNNRNIFSNLSTLVVQTL